MNDFSFGVSIVSGIISGVVSALIVLFVIDRRRIPILSLEVETPSIQHPELHTNHLRLYVKCEDVPQPFYSFFTRNIAEKCSGKMYFLHSDGKAKYKVNPTEVRWSSYGDSRRTQDITPGQAELIDVVAKFTETNEIYIWNNHVRESVEMRKQSPSSEWKLKGSEKFIVAVEIKPGNGYATREYFFIFTTGDFRLEKITDPALKGQIEKTIQQ